MSRITYGHDRRISTEVTSELIIIHICIALALALALSVVTVLYGNPVPDTNLSYSQIAFAVDGNIHWFAGFMAILGDFAIIIAE